MKLKHASESSFRIQNDRHTFGQRLKTTAVRAWHSATKWGRGLLVAGLIGAPCAGAMIGCTDDQTTQAEEAVFPKTGIVTTPYNGEILQDENGTYYMATRFIVAFKEEIYISDSEVEGLTGGRITGKIPGLNAYQVEVAKEKLDKAIGEVRKDARVNYSMRNSFLKLDTTLDNYDCKKEDGSSCGHTLNSGLWWKDSIQLKESYDLLEQRAIPLKRVTVVVLDSCFYLDHPDLKGQSVPSMYHWDVADSTSNKPDSNVSCDDVDVHLKDKDGNPILDQDGNQIKNPSYSHGTVVTGLIAASNNGQYFNGVAFNAKILPIKVVQSKSPYAYDYLTLATLIDLFAASGTLDYLTSSVLEPLNIKVVNMSFGGYTEEPLLGDAISHLSQKGVIFVASAGNNSKDLKTEKHYPSSYPYVISVGATENIGGGYRRAQWPLTDPKTGKSAIQNSNYSSEDNLKDLTISAPGTNISGISPLLSDTIDKLYTIDHKGTSVAAPLTSGLVALMAQVKPDLTYDEAVQYLRQGAEDIPLDVQGNATIDPNPALVWKRINAFKTLQTMLDEPNALQLSCNTLLTVPEPFGSIFQYLWFGDNKLGFVGFSDLQKMFVYDFSKRLLIQPPEACWTPLGFDNGNTYCFTGSRHFELAIVDSGGNTRTVNLAHEANLESSVDQKYLAYSPQLDGCKEKYTGVYLYDLNSGEERTISSSGIRPKMHQNRVVYIEPADCNDEGHVAKISDGEVYIYDTASRTAKLISSGLYARIFGNNVLVVSKTSIKLIDISDLDNPRDTILADGALTDDNGFTVWSFGLHETYAVWYKRPDILDTMGRLMFYDIRNRQLNETQMQDINYFASDNRSFFTVGSPTNEIRQCTF
ncbi:MAG: S8 family serine peptidase [Candidatus Micrarchaeota archaeon]